MNIASIERTTEGAFPGKQAVTLFVQGCNLRCAYCGYGSYVSRCQDEAKHDWKYAETYIRKRLDRLDGVVFSGGEPTLQEDLKECMEKIRELGLAIMLETNGTEPEIIRDLMNQKLVDYIAMDVKAPLLNYANIAGLRLDTEKIRNSIWMIKHSEIPHEFKTTVVPGLHTSREIKAISELIHGAQKYVVQDFVSTNPLRPELQGRPAFPHKPLEDIRTYVERRVSAYEIRHFEEARQMPVSRRRRPSSAVA